MALSQPSGWDPFHPVIRVAAACLLFILTTSSCSRLETASSATTSPTLLTTPTTSAPRSTTSLTTSTTTPPTTAPTSLAPSTSLPQPEATIAAGDADFTDPQGTYHLTVPAAWQANHGTFVAEIEAWLVAPTLDGFTPNVNIVTQFAPGLSLSEYLTLGIDNGPLLAADFELLDSSIIEGDKGQSLAMMEYTGSGLQFLGVFTMTANGQAIVATLTAPPDRYGALRNDVLTYLLTLMPLAVS